MGFQILICPILRVFCVISMELLSLSRRRSSERNVPSGKEQGETDVFAGYGGG